MKSITPSQNRSIHNQSINNRPINRRHFIGLLAGLSGWAMLRPLAAADNSKPLGRVVVIGGGFGGATCAKYLRKVNPAIAVTLVEAEPRYITCPFSNLVLGGLRDLASITIDYGPLQTHHGIRLIHDRAICVDPLKHQVRLQNGQRLTYDRLVVAPGVALKWGSPEGYDAPASQSMPHAWKAGTQTLLLRRQLEAMPDGGVVAIAVPPKPFRCPPGPYERASMIAHYLKRHKPKAKLLILDANESFSKQGLFTAAWKQLYPGMIEHIPLSEDGAVTRVDTKTMRLYTELEEHRVDVANVIPAQTAGAIAQEAGLTDHTGWCPIDPRTFESTRIKNIHVLGDATLAGAMPKSGSAANSQAKTCALAIAALLRGAKPGSPSFHNTCYSLVAPKYGISVSAIYKLNNGEINKVEGSGGVSPTDALPQFRAREALYTQGWYQSIIQDSFA